VVDNQHRKISGYRDLSEAELEVINQIKEIGRTIGGLIDAMGRGESIDHRWLAIAETDLQKGFMAWIRAITKPGGF
jgi:hypothetical protein